jgi:hypothetical protein
MSSHQVVPFAGRLAMRPTRIHTSFCNPSRDDNTADIDCIPLRHTASSYSAAHTRCGPFHSYDTKREALGIKPAVLQERLSMSLVTAADQ